MNDVKLPKPCPVDEVVGKVILAIDMPKEEGHDFLNICFTDGTFLSFKARIHHRYSTGEAGLFEETQQAFDSFGTGYVFACQSVGLKPEQVESMRVDHWNLYWAGVNASKAERERAEYERLKAKYGPQTPGTSTR